MKLDKISIPIATVLTVVIAAVGWASSYFGNLNAQAASDADIRTVIAVHETKIQNITDSLNSQDERMTRFENKIDAILIHDGLNPDRFNQ